MKLLKTTEGDTEQKNGDANEGTVLVAMAMDVPTQPTPQQSNSWIHWVGTPSTTRPGTFKFSYFHFSEAVYG